MSGELLRTAGATELRVLNLKLLDSYGTAFYELYPAMTIAVRPDS